MTSVQRATVRTIPAVVPQPTDPTPGAAAPTGVALGEVVLTLAATAAGFGSFLGYFGPPWWMLPVAGALLLGAATAILFSWRRWPGWLVVPVAVVVLLVFQTFALYAGTTSYGLPKLATLTALRDGLLSGWARMLTVALPADPSGDLMAMPTLLAFASGMLAALLVLNTRAVVALAAAPVLVFTSGLLVTASRPRFGLISTAVLLVALIVLLLVRTNRLSAAQDGIAEATAGAVGVDLAAQRRHSTTGRVLIGLPAAALIVAAAVAGGAFLPIATGAVRADPRSLVQPPVNLTPRLSPLVEVKPQLTAGTQTSLYRVTVLSDPATTVTAIRIAALDSFDGALWTESGSFVAAGSQLPQPLTLAGTAVDISLRVEVLTERTPFLPVVGVPAKTSGIATAVEANSGSLISVAAANGQSVSPVIYDLTGRVVPLTGVESASVAPDAARYTLLPNAPSWLNDYARSVTDQWTTSWQKLQALETRLYAAPYNLSARPGESYGAVYRLLEGTASDRQGYAEQYASAFALLARSLGFPSRVAVGYLLKDTERSGNTYTVTTADAHAWPEVLLAGYGWVPFEPTNTRNNAGPPPPQAPEVPQLPQTPTQPRVGQPDPAGPPGSTGTGSGAATAVRLGALVAAAIVVLIVLVLGGIVTAKALRRQNRRNKGSPARRIAAGWQEVLDRLAEAGHPIPVGQTPVEVSEMVAALPGLKSAGLPVTELAFLVTAAVCAPTPPPASSARQAWSLHDAVVKAVTANRSLPARVQGAIDPRSLFPGATRLHSDARPDSAPAPGVNEQPPRNPRHRRGTPASRE